MNACERITTSFSAAGLLVLGLSILLHGAPGIASPAENDLFVSPRGSGTACSRAKPCDLQTAVAQADDGDAVYLDQGTYTGTGQSVVSITESIALYGGWDGATSGPLVRDSDAYVTSLDGELARRVMYVYGPLTATVEGLRIVNGRTFSSTAGGWDGAGLYARDGMLTVRDTDFISNVADVYDFDAANSYSYGGGMCVEGGTLEVISSTFAANSAWARRASKGGGLAISGTLTAAVTGSVFRDNDAWHASGVYVTNDYGSDSPFILRESVFLDNGQGHGAGAASGGYAGAVKVVNAKAQIEENRFEGSRAVNDYGAVCIFSSDLSLARNVIAGNECGETSGLYLSGVSPFTVSNNIIAANETRHTLRPQAAVEVRGGKGRFLHNTIARNESPYGLMAHRGTDLMLTDTLLYSHTLGISVSQESSVTLRRTLFYAHPGGDTGGPGTIVNTEPLTGENPRLTADHHLGCGSPAIDAGVNAGLRVDIDGEARPRDGGYDIGADEFCRTCTYLAVVLRGSRASGTAP